MAETTAAVGFCYVLQCVCGASLSFLIVRGCHDEQVVLVGFLVGFPLTFFLHIAGSSFISSSPLSATWWPAAEDLVAISSIVGDSVAVAVSVEVSTLMSGAGVFGSWRVSTSHCSCPSWASLCGAVLFWSRIPFDRKANKRKRHTKIYTA